MRLHFLALVTLAIVARSISAADSKVIASGLNNPRAVVIGFDGRIYVSVTDDPAKKGSGAIVAIENGKAVPFASGLDSPAWMTTIRDLIFVTDQQCIWRIDRNGKATQFVKLADFPDRPGLLNGICSDERGLLYVAATKDGARSAIYRVNPRGKVETVIDGFKQPPMFAVSGIAMDGLSKLLTIDAQGTLNRVGLSNGLVEELAKAPPDQLVETQPNENSKIAFGAFSGGMVWDMFGRLYRTGQGRQAAVIARPANPPLQSAHRFTLPGAPCLSHDGKSILVPDIKAGTVVALPAQVPGAPVDETPLPIETEVVFADMKWSGWTDETPSGKVIPLRPIELTHANDQSGRIFVATQHGVVHVFPNDQAVKQTKVFLDIQEKVRYNDATNEEGFLGLTFHPSYKANGEFFVFYTDKKGVHTNVVSRFRVSKDDPDRADPTSEEVLLRIDHRFWNHDGGTLIFGPDGYLYIAIGDGGAANDPDQNGQNLDTILAKIIRIDVDRKDNGKPYAIPKDNPFVGQPGKRPEIWAYGLRNVWRMAFDRSTGKLWAADVGQNLYEEIDLIEKGGNYGWNVREGLHPFGPKGVGPKPDLIDPIWEYHHDLGKSITGGLVYRGKQFPELSGSYLYADYVSGKIWALAYSEKLKRVVANRPIHDHKLPILSFGEDDRGEVYLLTYSANGQGISRLKRK